MSSHNTRIHSRLGRILCIIFTLSASMAHAVAGDDPGFSLPGSHTPPQDRAARRSPIVRVFEQSRDAVVNVNTTKLQRVRSMYGRSVLEEMFDMHHPRYRAVGSVGSGFIIHEAGLVLTNYHVVAQTTDISITLADGRSLPAKVIAEEPRYDLAILKVDSDKPLPALKLGRSDDIMVGETVVAIGNPLGLEHTVTTGIVSAVGRDVPLTRDVVYDGLIQTDAAINPGNSGGPLLNLNGELIGINSAIRGDAQNVGFAIPVDRVWTLLPRMLDVERWRHIDVGLTVTGPRATVVAVRADSPASKAGLRVGDEVEAFAGEAVTSGVDFLIKLLLQEPGDKPAIVVRRGEQSIRAEAPLEAIPMPDGKVLASRLFGVEVAEFSPELRRRYDIPAGIGLMVDDVERGGPAERLGLEPYDVLLQIGGASIASADELGLILRQVASGDVVPIRVLRVERGRPLMLDGEIRAR